MPLGEDAFTYVGSTKGTRYIAALDNGTIRQPTTIYVDPQNKGLGTVPGTSTASDLNDGSTPASAIMTFQKQVSRWSGHFPRVMQPTVIQFLSGHTDNSDSVELRPIIQGGTLRVQGTFDLTTQIAKGVLSGTVARNPAAGGGGQLLNATLAAGLTAGQFIVNTDKAGSLGILHRNLGANLWAISQTFSASSIPPPFNPAELNTWANGDNYIVYAPTQINLAAANPILSVGDAAADYMLQFYRIGVRDPTGNLFEQVITDIGVSFVECAINRAVMVPSPQSALGAFFYNCFLRDGILGGTVLGRHATFGPKIWGGIIGGTTSGLTITHLLGATLQADVILNASTSNQPNELGACRIGAMYLDTNVVSHASATFMGSGLFHATGFEPLRIWGPGRIDTIGQTRLSYPPGAGAAVACFLNAGGVLLNGQAFACFDASTNSGARTTSNAVTPANMDALMGAGVTDGALYIPGGSSISNDENSY